MRLVRPWSPWVPFLVVVLLISPLLFWHLDGFPLRIWDESRLASNALEMQADGDWIVTHFDGQPDMWNTKPPLLIWVQVATMTMIGAGDLAVRLPSAAAALLTCLVLMVFARSYLQDLRFGVIAALVLATSPGFMGEHGARTADYDVPMTLLTTLSCLGFFQFLETARQRYLSLFFVSLTLAILTKGVGAVLFLPALALLAAWRRQVPALLRNRQLYIGGGILLACVAGYYGLREHHNPGYLAAVQANELGGRYLRAIEGHGESPFWFLTNLWRDRMPFWAAFIPLGMATGLVRRGTRVARLTRFATLLAVSYVLIISLGQTKCLWYDLPAYPFLAIIVAALITSGLNWFENLRPLAGRRWMRGVPYVLIAALCLLPYLGVLKQARRPGSNRGFYTLGYVLKDALAGRRDLDGMVLLTEPYSPQNDFYIRLLRNRGVDVARKELSALQASERVLVADPQIEAALIAAYDCEVLDRSELMATYEIHGKLAP